MVTAIVTIFIIGYLCIALESVFEINKAVPALLMCVICWTLYALGYAPEVGADTSAQLLHHLGDTCEILFFLMGAMTIVEIVDANGGFFFVKRRSGHHKQAQAPLAHRLYGFHPLGYPRQPHNFDCDDYGTPQARG